MEQILRLEPAKEQVVSEFYRIKKNKFAEHEVDSWYDALKEAKLI